MDLNDLLRSKDTASAIRLLGDDYDFKTDPRDALGAATWYSCNDFVYHAVSKGGSVHAETGNGTLLGIASSMGNVRLVKFFIEHGAKINQLDKYGRSALVCAAGSGKFPVVKLLVTAGADLTN